MHSVSDLTTSSRKTSGTVPPKLVGASTTIVGDKMYLFGGRLVAERRMVSDLHVFDLETFVWTKVPPFPGDDIPGARYFHSADSSHLARTFGLSVFAGQNFLIIFGGMGHKPDAASSDDLVVLNDVRFLDLSTFRWLPAEPHSPAVEGGAVDPIDPIATTNDTRNEFVPRARYAHLSSVSGSRLYIIGGQDLQNAWLDDICVYDLRAKRWASRKPYPRHAGTYRSVAVAAQLRVRDPARENTGDRTAHTAESSLGPLGGRFNVEKRPPSSKGEYTPSENLVHLPYSTEATDESPNEIFLYSNYNFTDVKRELEVFTPKAGSVSEFDVNDRSAAMTGTVLPPGLRFPTGAICGNHLIFAGTYLAHSYQSYSIWALDLTTMAWSRLDPGAALSTGSWFRAALWNSPAKGTSSLLIFGNRQGSLVEDYNRRLLAWDDVAVLDLEAFGIYQPPPRQLDERSQELGLAALEEGLFADFEVVCDDGRRIPCSRRLLESRWPWFRDQRRLLQDQANRAVLGSPELSASANTAPLLPPDGELIPAPVPLIVGQQPDARPDPRTAPRALMLGEPYAVSMALLQYVYTLALLTPLQHAPAVLSQLLLLSSSYSLQHLQRLVRHAMHRALAPTTSVGVYEVATLCGCQSLQIRALKAVMASSRRNTGRARGNSNAGGGAGAPPRGGGGGGGGGPTDRDRSNSEAQALAARARGMSDLRGMNYTSYSGSGAGGGTVREAEVGKILVGAEGDMNARTNGVRPKRNANSQAMWPEDVQSDVDADADLDGEGESEMSGKETEDDSESGENRAETATPTAASASATRSSRIKHSVNLSMDSIYMALQAADGDNSSDAEVDQTPDSAIDPHPPALIIPNSVPLPLSPRMPPPTSPSVLSPVPRSPQMDIEEELRRESEKGKERDKLSVEVEAASLSPVRRRAYSALADLAIPQVPQPPPSPPQTPQSSINPSPRSSLLVTTASMYAPNSTPSPSPISAGAATPVLPFASKSSLVRKNSLTADDSDCAGGSSSSRSTRPSPLTPDSPPLLTPAGEDTPHQTSFNSYGVSEPNSSDEITLTRQGSTNKYQPISSPSPLSPSAPSMRIASSQDSRMSTSTNHSIATASTSSVMFGRLNGFGVTRPRSNSYAYAHVDGYNNENVQFVDIVEPESEGRTGWTDIRLPRDGLMITDAKAPQYRTLHKSPTPTSSPPGTANGPPPSPNTLTFAASVNSGLSSDIMEKRASGGRRSPIGGGFFKSRIKSKKMNGQTPSPGDSPLSPTFGNTNRTIYQPSINGSVDNASIVSGWADVRDIKKAAKAEEKRRKKAEEKAKLEALAAQFSQHRAKTQQKDGMSVVSGGSSERRRAANEWVEDSAGMYGAGSIAVWGGL
ncbi:hypothetical protein ACEPAF_9982 [Sanghuangporus sanghuang]